MSSFAQSDPRSAPVDWKRYKTADHRLSVMFPKLPLVREVVNACSETLSTLYYAYADGAVYELAVSEMLPKDRASKQICLTPVKKFGHASVDSRMTTLIEAGLVSEKKLATLHSRVVVKFSSDKSTHWVISDIDANDRWIELAVYHHADLKVDMARFLRSLEFSAREGFEIATGAETMVGDPSSAKPSEARFRYTGSSGGDTGAKSRVPEVSRHPNPVGIRVISKPQPRYTDAAREAGEHGTVRLNVTLLANGSVGDVTVVTPLKYGLTEQAIEAARKIVFLPKRVNGMPVSSIVTIDYPFSID